MLPLQRWWYKKYVWQPSGWSREVPFVDYYNIDLSNPLADHPLTKGLVGCWIALPQLAKGSIWYDLSGYNNHGTLTNMDPSTDWVYDGERWGLDFDGIDDYVTAAALDSPFLGPITILTWVHIDTDDGNSRHFCGKHLSNGATNNPFDFRTNYDIPPKLALVRANSDYRVYYGPSTLVGEWALYGVVSDRIQDLPTFYVNTTPTTGSLYGTHTGTGYPTGVNANIRIGIRDDNATKMDGQIAALAIWNRLFSAEEVTQFYDESRRGYPNMLRRLQPNKIVHDQISRKQLEYLGVRKEF